MESPPIIVYRIGHQLHRLGLTKLAFLITWLNRLVFATYLPCSAEIGRNFTLGYWGLGVVIHSRARIGDNCWIGQNVTIGRKGNDIKVPVIEDGAYIATGAVVVGEITIGKNAIIGANSFVNTNVPENTTFAGSPARLIKNHG
ncbi:hypothetical protein MLD52_15180 [Puniceicoccaceae bacterium K14]|nr:hypothetical protein [Puniceicoccaceae bacterium K14]